MTTRQRPLNIPHQGNPEVSRTNYTQRRGQPFLFCILDPNGQPAFDHALALHTNPNSVTERMTKSKNIVMTYGGFVEFNWPDELDVLSASHSTGAFLGPKGLVSGFDRLDASLDDADRKNTIAWERAEDLLEIFHNNGLIYDGFGKPVLRGTVQLMYDRGIFRGFFTSFSVVEDSMQQFSFQLSWEFKVEQTIYRFPASFVSRDASTVQTSSQSTISRLAQQQLESSLESEVSEVEVNIPGETATLRNSVVENALRELERWKNLQESDPAAQSILENYWEATGQSYPGSAVAWSAAMIERCVKNSDNPDALFSTGAHIFYARQAFKDRGVPGKYGAFEPSEVVIEPGDIVIKGRGDTEAGKNFSFSDIQKGGNTIETHGDIVTEVSLDGIKTVGGNINNKVEERTVPANNGRLSSDTKIIAVLKLQT